MWCLLLSESPLHIYRPDNKQSLAIQEYLSVSNIFENEKHYIYTPTRRIDRCDEVRQICLIFSTNRNWLYTNTCNNTDIIKHTQLCKESQCCSKSLRKFHTFSHNLGLFSQGAFSIICSDFGQYSNFYAKNIYQILLHRPGAHECRQQNRLLNRDWPIRDLWPMSNVAMAISTDADVWCMQTEMQTAHWWY